MYILSQVLIAISDVFCIISMINKKKRNVVINLLLSTILFGLHFVCLSGWTGAAMCLVEIAFLIVIYILESKNKSKYNIYVTIFAIILSVVLSYYTWAGLISILPMFAMIIYLIGMIFKNIIIVKSGTFIRLVLNAIYMILIKSYFGAGLTLVIFGFAIYGIIRDYREKKEKTLAKE